MNVNKIEQVLSQTGTAVKRLGKIGIIGVTLTIVTLNMMGINEAGKRTVIQWPDGTLNVKFEPGPYLQLFGSEEIYSDIMTLDYDKTDSEADATIDQPGIPVRYQDGGTGTVYGIARFRLPSDKAAMVAIHKEFRSNNGLAYKLIKTITEETMNHTAGFMNSEESYTERGRFAQMAQAQLELGKYQTKQKTIITTEAGFEYCLEKTLTTENKRSCKNVKKVTKVVPDIATKDGKQLHVDSDLKNYGITVSGFQMIDWGYEPKTLAQIAAKRAATMAIITSKANAERAKQDTITAEQQGLANVKVAQYEKEVEKQRAVVDAERTAEVAVIAAKQKVDVAEQVKQAAVVKASQLVEVAAQQKLEAKEKKLAAKEYKQEQILRGEGDGEYKRLVMKADGALQQKLDTYERVNTLYAQAISKQKWVPEIVMGSGGDNSGSAANDLISMLNTKIAKDLALDMSMKGTK